MEAPSSGAGAASQQQQHQYRRRWSDALPGEGSPLPSPLQQQQEGQEGGGLRHRRKQSIPESDEQQQQAYFSSQPASPSTREEEAAALAAQRSLPVESRRRLGGFETLFAYSVPYGLGCIYYVVDFDGPADTELLRQSMRLQVKRHPNLRSRIVDGNYLESIPFEACPDFQVAYAESEDVVGYTETAMKEAEAMKRGSTLYLWRLALHYTPSADRTHLVFLIHHAISDGDSILRLLQSLVVGMAHLVSLPGSPQAQAAAALAAVEPLPQLPSADAQLYPKYNGWYLVYHCRTLLKELWKVILQPRIPRPVRETWGHKERITRISSFSLDAPDFKRLLQACKAQKTSVTGALVAATCEAMQGFIDDKGRYTLKVEVLVNFRGKCVDAVANPHAAEAHQLYASLIDVLVPAGGGPDTALDFWAAARASKGDVEWFASAPHAVVDSLDFFYTLGHHPVSWPLLRLFAASFKQGRQKALSVSNLGMTDKLFQAAGPWKLGRMQMGIDELLIGHSVFLAVASHEGRLNFTLSYADPIVTRAMAEDYGQAVIRSLRNACPECEPAAASTAQPQTPVSLTAKPAAPAPAPQQLGSIGGASSFSEADAEGGASPTPRGGKRPGGA